MSTRLRDAAVRHLRSLGETTGEGAVRRLTMDIEIEGRIELVTLALRDEQLQCVSSDGRNDGPHVVAALRFIAGTESNEPSSPPAPAASVAGRPVERGAFQDLAAAIDDLLTAITRVGVDKARHAPSVDAALERVIAMAPHPTPSGLGRFIGRLQQEMRLGDVRSVARILDGASRLASELRPQASTPESEERVSAWLGPRPGCTPKPEMLYDRTMVEVGREWLSGTERTSVERRYLVDVTSGGIYREDRPRQATASLGPCPRQLRVGLAEVEAGPTPRRIRVLQYEVQLDVPRETWECLQQVASRSIAEVTEHYKQSVKAYPSLSEPFALIAPYRIERNGVFKALDTEGRQLILNRAERRGAALAFCDLLAEGVEPRWIAGRLTDCVATLCLTPFSLGARGRVFTRL